ncbi:MAG: twitching motility protein PilT [Desulfuromonadales bacterium GWD2_61_12]|nr:MAG: twitching motility protein PilT [Desulfuromonadales bacterium GWC2_61_20]OGR36028.1 MAG: twitching motility protein PilT [Desulfuromonadales bacterium GWD2_61_12]HAD04987.1 VapC toxin family PIN domain ribonuclease [Desulfuromonas sp.]HBT83523.1 VapC toxin family PIN domain ribonuclease [Desulfuromonas sp.]
MVTFDTNLWVRYLTNDDKAQARRALALLEQSEAVFLPKTVLLEVEWVLRAAYRIEAAVIHKSLLQILGLPMVTAESPGQIAAALDFYAQGFDFADALHLASSEASEAFYTFDEHFIRKGRDALPPVMAVPTR